MSERAKGLSRQQMCDRLAMEFGDGWIVNLGIGIPTLCSNFDFGDKEIIFHSENGVIGYGPLAAGRQGGSAPGQRRRPARDPAAGSGDRPSRGFIRDDPRRADRCDRARRL